MDFVSGFDTTCGLRKSVSGPTVQEVCVRRAFTMRALFMGPRDLLAHKFESVSS